MQTFEYLTYSYIFFEYNIGIISLKFEKNCKSYINVLKMYKLFKNLYSAKYF